MVSRGGITWVYKVREDNMITRYETEKAGLRNDYETQIRDLKAQIGELQKQPSRQAAR
jgi:hypothetical protein